MVEIRVFSRVTLIVDLQSKQNTLHVLAFSSKDFIFLADQIWLQYRAIIEIPSK